MMCCKRLLLCFHAALSTSPLHLAPLHFLIPQHPAASPSSCSQPLTPPLLTPSRWNLSGFNWLVSIKFWKHMNSLGTSKWTSLQLVISASSSFASLDSRTSVHPQTCNWCLSLPLYSQIFPFITWPSLSLRVSLCFPYLSLPYPFLPPLLNRSPRQWLSHTRPPSWDQEEANAFLMRPRPQCDTVKWQESVAGEPLVQGIYHLKPSDPLCLWEGGREGGGER